MAEQLGLQLFSNSRPEKLTSGTRVTHVPEVDKSRPDSRPDPIRSMGPGREFGTSVTFGLTSGTERDVSLEIKEVNETPTLRPYQLEAIAAVEAKRQAGSKRQLLELATGLGKTVIASSMIRRNTVEGRRSLFVAHREELLTQTLDKLGRFGVNGSLEQASNRASLQSPVVVASVQSLQGARLERFPRDHFDELFVDEAHHAVSPTYLRVVERFEFARVLGLTATPGRLDGKGLGRVFDCIAYRLALREAIAADWLAAISMQRVLLKSLDLRGVRKTAGDFNAGQLGAAMADERVLHEIAKPLVDLAGARRTIVFCVSVANAHALAAVLQARYGKSAVALDGSADKAERRDVLTRYERGDFQFLINCALFTEGFDSPGIECVALARPTLSVGLVLQMIGRGTRKAPGKTNCLILDFVGNSRHRLVSPVDALAGDAVDDDVREEVERLLVKDAAATDVVELLERAKKFEMRTDVEAVIVAAYRVSEVDPWLAGFATNGPPGGGPITELMRTRIIEELGMRDPPKGLTMDEAERWIAGATRRRRAGLCSFKQARALRRAQLDDAQIAKMPAARAGALMSILAAGDPRRGIKPWSAELLAHVPERKGNIR